MNQRRLEDLSNLSMLELFRIEVEGQTALLNSGLLELERGPGAPAQLEVLMRAAHSLKGAARIVNLEAAVQVAHAMEDCFVAAQTGKLQLAQPQIDALFRGVDLLTQLSREADPHTLQASQANEVRLVLVSLRSLMSGEAQGPGAGGAKAKALTPTLSHPMGEGGDITPVPSRPIREGGGSAHALSRSMGEGEAKVEQRGLQRVPSQQVAPVTMGQGRREVPERVVRLTAENLNRLLGLAGESLVESRWLRPFAESLQRIRRQHVEVAEQLDQLRRMFEDEKLSERAEIQFHELSRMMAECQYFFSARVEELDAFDRRSAHLSHRLYLEVLRTRMRPFAEGVRRFPRMVRDLARSLGKEVRLEIVGEHTQVDRDILERLETPLAHLLRNAVDHGCETPDERSRAGKCAECLIRIEARHSAGMLMITLADDGAGVDPERLRRVIVQRKLTVPEIAEKLTEAELLDFLFLPGFTLKETVTEISGRGVGLDVVQNMVKSVRGAIRLSTDAGRGLRVQVQLPLTLSVLRALLIEVGGEPYAIPLAQITRTLKLARESIQTLEGRHHFRFGDQQIGLLTAHQVLECGQPKSPGHELPIVVIGDRQSRYGLVVDRFLGERELVVQPLDPRLGKVTDISAAALMEDGSPVLIIDVEDMVRSIEKLVTASQLAQVQPEGIQLAPKRQKRVLAVDDSLTVRELERKLLTGRGYLADVAVDGMDGWNAVRTGQYDLIITDVDMPRMDGIELAALIKQDPRLKSLPVMIVSYKDEEQDRLRGLEAGADYYLTKGSFHDERLLEAVVDLIGEPEA